MDTCALPSVSQPAHQPRRWEASLTLAFSRSGPRTLMHARHHGPMQVQKALYPEGPAVCHALPIHPPGGIAGGDRLAVDLDVAPGAHTLITTPGATRWYKAEGEPAAQHLRMRVAGVLEWLPQETIVYDAALAESRIEIEMLPGSAMIGWDRIALGRAASGERFLRGVFAQSIRLRANGELVWHERTRIAGGDKLLDSPVGLAGRHVFGCAWAWRDAGWSDEDLDALRAQCEARGLTEVPTRLEHRIVVARAIASTTSELGEQFERLWSVLRPMVAGRKVGERPRIWRT